jgi:hypothetical protein
MESNRPPGFRSQFSETFRRLDFWLMYLVDVIRSITNQQSNPAMSPQGDGKKGNFYDDY